MSDAAFRLQLTDQEQPGIWPWIIGAVALVLMVITITQSYQRIPRSLLVQARNTASSLKIKDVVINVDGRDVSLAGTIAKSVNRDAFAARLALINGVRVVRDNMQEFDPLEQVRLDKLAFRQVLDNISRSRVAFEAGSTLLTADSSDPLTSLVQLLRAYPDFLIRIAGHTDNTGRPEVNLRISRQRAQVVGTFLTERGVNPAQVIAQGYGATRPIADNSTESGRALNRRIELNYVD